MPSDELRKKWGVIFMGDREATLEQIDAMQEPVLRERQQKDRQEEYLERVRKRAADRAREILGQAYAERQKVLAEAEHEIAIRRDQLLKEIEAIRAEAVTLRTEARAELDRARQVGAEADELKKNAHDEGYQIGVDAAGQELKEFRADMGNELAQIMRAIEGQFVRMAEGWRDDLCELVRVAVAAGTGYVLDTHLEDVLNGLVNQAITLLEQREVISFRVHPEDEAIVNDLFRAAREKAPEIKQWIVNPDETVERGGLVAESGSGSVDLRRANFQELVDSILPYLALPVKEEEREHAQALHETVLARAQAVSDVPEPVAEVPNEKTAEQKDTQVAPEPGAHAEAVTAQDILFGKTEQAQQAAEEGAPGETDEAHEETADAPPELPDDVFEYTETADASTAQPRAQVLQPEPEPEPDLDLAGRPGMPPLTPPKPETVPAASLADLEEELFPVGSDDQTVLQNGGFLPGSPQ